MGVTGFAYPLLDTGQLLKYPLLKYEFYFLNVHYNLNIIKDHLYFSGLDENNEEVKRLNN